MDRARRAGLSGRDHLGKFAQTRRRWGGGTSDESEEEQEMNKAELIDRVAAMKDAGCETKAAAERAVNAVIDGIKAGIKKNGKVQLVGFGSFTVRTRKARTGRNPQTGETIKIKESKTVGFAPGQGFKDEI
jgi:DNA-binding protein HU-beta